MSYKKERYRSVKKEQYTQVSNSLLNDNEASLQAKGLLSIFLSNADSFELHMKEIIKRSKNGRDAHYNAVNELIKLGYFARITVLNEINRFEYVEYIFSDLKQEVETELENIKQWAEKEGKILQIEYKTVKKKSARNDSKPFPENQDTESSNTEIQYNNNTKSNNTNLNNINNKNIDDDKRTSPTGEVSAKDNNESINLIISNFREQTKGDLTDRSFNAVVRKVIDKHNQGAIRDGKSRDYLATSLANKIHELEFRRAKDAAKEQLKASAQARVQRKKQQLENAPIKSTIPFYNWLEE